MTAAAPPAYSSADISALIWDEKYRARSPDGSPLESSLEETRDRVAAAVSAAEADAAGWRDRFRRAFADFRLIPGGRITAAAGLDPDRTLVNTFMMGRLPDDPAQVHRAMAESAATLRSGGGLGCDFSTLPPSGTALPGRTGVAVGPLPYLHRWDRMCRAVEAAGPPGRQRGAMMAMLRCDHPDIEEFVGAKRRPGALEKFNVSVLVTDDFVRAVEADEPWPLRHRGRVHRTVPATALWRHIMETTYECSEPGVIFIDRMNAENNLRYCEDIAGTNSCGEAPLPHYGSCPLASINLAALVERPFQPTARLDTARFADLVRTGVRLLDDVLDVSPYPLPAQRAEAQGSRRIGLGVTGLADALAMCRVGYGSAEAAALVEEWLGRLREQAYLASAELAAERGSFPRYDPVAFPAVLSRRGLPDHVVRAVRRTGIRNGSLTAIAPTGTMSMLAGNVSSGIEPVFSLVVRRRLAGRSGGGGAGEVRLHDYGYEQYLRLGGDPATLPGYLVTAADLAPGQHLATQALVQRFVDGAVSKTINCPADLPFSALERIYLEAYRLGCKGCATYRPSPVRGHVLSPQPQSGGRLPPAGRARRRRTSEGVAR